MELLQAIQTRHSTRKFKTDSVEKNKLEYIIEAGRMAPSGGNTQLTHFVVITNPGVLAKLITLVQEEYGKMEITENTLPYMVNIIKAAAAGTFVFNYNAPALVILTSPRTYGNNFADSACAMQNMMLAANELNLGSCWVNQLRWLHDNPVVMDFLATLGISQDEMVCASLVVGYANLPNVQAPILRILVFSFYKSILNVKFHPFTTFEAMLLLFPILTSCRLWTLPLLQSQKFYPALPVSVHS